jgi:hypothetical protein
MFTRPETRTPVLCMPWSKTIKNLLAAGRINQATVDILNHFHHPGFPAYE